MSNLKNLKSKAADKIARQEAATVIAGANPQVNDEDAPRFYLLELELPDNVKVLLSGAKPFIPLQASLIKAFDDVLRARIDSEWSAKQFWRWAKEFENGFSNFTVGTKDVFAQWQKKNKPWGKDPENKPRITEIKIPVQSKGDVPPHYKTIFFLADRTVENDFQVFTGSYREIAQQITNWWNQKQKDSGFTKERGGDFPILKGQPLIKLYFYEDAGASTKGKAAIKGEISLRVTDKSANPKSSLPAISKADLKKYAQIIQKQFGDNGGYVWKKGRETISYRNRHQGFEGWYFVKDKGDGIELIKRLLAIFNHTIDLTCVHHSVNVNSVAAYPENPPPVTVLGEKTPIASRRPLANVRFRRAEIILLAGQKPIELVRNSVVVYKG
ncbi:hypothetical protein [Microcoleus sp. bin38.metabat.b11b12b14.051]|uniref:hypothetical protein n=1 Tax=Microcoleus sp. bin38.metabat.b11b12b14.051 TaxID=2742709 RepID=UPI0025E141A1|nr:hypothetical protein [Microcoleus sp. bin38.metabat.b11b12b14.051]